MANRRCRTGLLLVICSFGASCGDSGPSEDSRIVFDIVIVSGDNQTDTVGQVLPTRFAVKVVNASGSGVASADVTFSSIKGGGSISDPNAVVETDAGGVASVGLRLGSVAGVDSFTAETAHLPPARIAALAVHDRPASLAITAGNQQVATAGFPLASPLALRLLDQFANPIVGVAIAWTVPDSEGTLIPTAIETDPLGLASASWLLGLSIGHDTASGRATGTSVPPVHFAATSEALTVAELGVATSGPQHACAIAMGGDIYCWGRNETGQLGDGTTDATSVAVRVTGGSGLTSITSGISHSCGLTARGAGYCWGANAVGELGDGTQTARLSPVPVMGGLIFGPLVAGVNHTCGVTLANEAYCWGDNASGQLGDSTEFSKFVPTRVAGGISFQRVIPGVDHTCGLDTSGAAHCWGVDFSPDDAPHLLPGGFHFASLFAGRTTFCGLTNIGAAYCWDEFTQTPAPLAGGLLFQSFAMGGDHACGVVASRVAYCWGANYAGQLGDGTKIDRTVPVAVLGGAKFSGLSLGLSHSCGRLLSGVVLCWGDNTYHQLGDGSTTGRTNPAGVTRPPGL